MAPAIPAVEIADDARALGIRRPRGERDAVDSVDRRQLRAEHPIRLAQLALAEQMEIEIGDDRAETIRIEVVVPNAVALPRDAIRSG